MDFKMLSALDEIAIELNGMAYVMEDDNDVYQAGRLRKISEKLRNISESERPTQKDKIAWSNIK